MNFIIQKKVSQKLIEFDYDNLDILWRFCHKVCNKGNHHSRYDFDYHEIVLFHFRHFVLILEKTRFNYWDWKYKFTESRTKTCGFHFIIAETEDVLHKLNKNSLKLCNSCCIICFHPNNQIYTKIVYN